MKVGPFFRNLVSRKHGVRLEDEEKQHSQQAEQRRRNSNSSVSTWRRKQTKTDSTIVSSKDIKIAPPAQQHFNENGDNDEDSRSLSTLDMLRNHQSRRLDDSTFKMGGDWSCSNLSNPDFGESKQSFPGALNSEMNAGARSMQHQQQQQRDPQEDEEPHPGTPTNRLLFETDDSMALDSSLKLSKVNEDSFSSFHSAFQTNLDIQNHKALDRSKASNSPLPGRVSRPVHVDSNDTPHIGANDGVPRPQNTDRQKSKKKPEKKKALPNFLTMTPKAPPRRPTRVTLTDNAIMESRCRAIQKAVERSAQPHTSNRTRKMRQRNSSVSVSSASTRSSIRSHTPRASNIFLTIPNPYDEGGDPLMGMYMGDVNADNIPHGQGLLRFFDQNTNNKEGHVYVGPFVNGSMHGRNAYYSWGKSSHLIYTGDFQFNLPHGQGELIGRYKGQFVKGNFHGFGIKFASDGSVDYMGQWKNGVPHFSKRYKATRLPSLDDKAQDEISETTMSDVLSSRELAHPAIDAEPLEEEKEEDSVNYSCYSNGMKRERYDDRSSRPQSQ